jgi:predicted enzyme related to lactoylglutathione lyase
MVRRQPKRPCAHARAITAILLESKRPERLASFYRDALGLELAWIDLPGFPPHFGGELGEVYVAILEGRPRPGLCVAFYVDDVVAAAKRLTRAGVRQLARPARTPLGLIGRFADPDGNPFELFQP